MRHSNYLIHLDEPGQLTLKDLGPWDQYMTITNNAEAVVAEVLPLLKGRRLFYIDSEGHTDELLVENGRFVGFKPGLKYEEDYKDWIERPEDEF